MRSAPRVPIVAAILLGSLAGCGSESSSEPPVEGKLLFIDEVTNSEGQPEARLFVSGFDGSDRAEVPLDDWDWVNSCCLRWSPDGTRFLANFAGADYSYSLVANRDGTGVESWWGGACDDWSPDGTKLACLSFSPWQWSTYVSVVDLAAHKQTHFGEALGPVFEHRIRWSADSTVVYYTAYDGDADESTLYVLDPATGTTTTRVAGIPGLVHSIARDGDSVILVHPASAGGDGEIVRRRLLSGEERRIARLTWHGENTGYGRGRFLESVDTMIISRGVSGAPDYASVFEYVTVTPQRVVAVPIDVTEGRYDHRFDFAPE